MAKRNAAAVGIDFRRIETATAQACAAKASFAETT
jgi:hypothetical protein